MMQSGESRNYKYEGCKTFWPQRKCVVDHLIQNTEVYFCLNCEDWIKDKTNVVKNDWLDQSGRLRTDV